MSDSKETKDLATVINTHEDGRFDILRSTSEGLVVDSCRKVVEGATISPEQEIIRLDATEQKNVYSVETLYKGPQNGTRSGPAMVASKAFRDGHDRIFGNSKGSSASN